MNIYENLATQAITSFFYNEVFWKKEILFNFLLKPFNLNFSDIVEVKTQDSLKGTIPDFTIVTTKSKIKYEVKINNSALTPSELEKDTRDAYLIRKGYYHSSDIPLQIDKILYWEDLFETIDRKGATKEFARLDMIREYMHEDIRTMILTPHEVAMLYSPKTIKNVYTMSKKILGLCKKYLDSHNDSFEYVEHYNQWGNNPEQDEWGIGYWFSERTTKDNVKRNFYIGLSLAKSEEDSFSVCRQNPDESTWGTENEWEIIPLDREILARCSTDEDLQEEFIKNVDEALQKLL